MFQDRKFLEQVRQILALIEDLQARGLRNKEISASLDMYPSAFSNFTNKVLKRIWELEKEGEIEQESIREIFDQVNNISELKSRQKMGRYIERLQALKAQPGNPVVEKDKSHRSSSPQDIMKKLEGIYDCYYLSTFGYRIKKEPLLIAKRNFDDHYLVKKGNDLGPSRYEGTGMVPNDHILSIQLKECDTRIRDIFTAHFQLPPFYSSTMNMLKGISISMSNSFLPISRKVILHRRNQEADENMFQKIETVFFENEQKESSEIIQYLQSTTSYLEYIPIPHPNFNPLDLGQERKLNDMLS